MRIFGGPNVSDLAARRDVAGLVKATSSNDVSRRREAAVALGRLGESSALPALLHLTGRRTTEEKRTSHSQWRGSAKEPQVPQEPDPSVHAAALGALGQLMLAVGVDIAALEAIVEDAAGGQGAAFHLREPGGWSFKVDVHELLNDEVVRSAARAALLPLCEEYPDRVGRQLLLRLTRLGGIGREDRALTLSFRDHPELIEDLVRALAAPGAFAMLTAAGDWFPHRDFVTLTLLGSMGDQAVGPATRALGSPKPLTRQIAAQVLARVQATKAITSLAQVLVDPDPIVRFEAAAALQRLGWRPASEEERIEYLIAAGKWDELRTIGPDIVEPLIRVLRTSQVAGESPPPPVPNNPMEGPEEWLRTRAAVSSAHPDQVRANAARILGKMADKRAVNPLIEVLNAGNLYTKRAAAESLGKLADQRAIDALTSARHTSWDTQLNQTIDEALRKLRKEKRQSVT